jgi:hypothetical protein
MIEQSYSEVFFSYFIFLSLVILLLCLREERRKERNKWRLTTRHLFHCDKCHYTFVPKESLSICRCPRCNELCIKRNHGDF